ncbi:MAG TPA: hypothetical protein VGD78_00665 [Chthoniobacterales bacterium]
MPPPDPAWQSAWLLAALVLLLWGAWRGWANGPWRLLVTPVALLLAYLLNAVAADPLTDAAIGTTHWPRPVTFLAVSVVLSLAGYQVFRVIGRRLCKRTRDHLRPATRLTYGITGAILGALTNLLWLWALVIAVRVLAHVDAGQPGIGAAADGSGSNVRRLAASMEAAYGKGLIDAVDPVPPWFYVRLDQWRRLLLNPEALHRFVTYPGFESLRSHPRLRAFEQDPKVARDLERGDFLALLTEPAFGDLMNDPSWWSTLTGPQLDAAMRYALDET